MAECGSIHRQRTTIFTSCFLMVLVIDLWNMESRSKMYAIDFSVSHIEWLYRPTANISFVPSPWLVGFLFLSSGMILLCWVCGLHWSRRWQLGTVASCYGYIYMSSMVDSYQHHYLVLCLLILLACFDEEWAQRLLCVTVGVVYFWTAVTKLSGQDWCDGWVIRKHGIVPGLLDRETTPMWIWSTIAWSIALGEMALAAGWIVIPALPSVGTKSTIAGRWYAWDSQLISWVALVFWVGGTLMHIGILLSRYQIRFFSHYMIILYFLVAPQPFIRYMHTWPLFH